MKGLRLRLDRREPIPVVWAAWISGFCFGGVFGMVVAVWVRTL